MLRDYVETCLRAKGTQYSRALQDLVNRLGESLGFEVEYGRYAGVKGEIGFDGHWKSPGGEHIVVEVKTTDVYAIKTAILLNYINELVSEGAIPEQSHRLGLYVVGRPDAELKQLENAIIAEKRTHELRIATVDSLLSLTELATDYDVFHESILGILFPSGPRIDPAVDLMARLVAQEAGEPEAGVPTRAEPTPPADTPETAYYLTPVQWKESGSPLAEVGRLLDARKYAFAERTPFRRHIRPRDWICFYASGVGVFAHAQIASAPRHEPLPEVTHDAASYPWTFDLEDVTIYEDDPVPLTAEVREQLDAFSEVHISKNWGWFVTATRKLTEHDFRVLTRQVGSADVKP